MSLGACGGDEVEPAAQAAADTAPDTGGAATAGLPAFGIVAPAVAAELAADPSVTVIDVRTPDEFAEGHLEGATMIDFSSPTFADDVAALDPAGNYLVYCRSGNRSGQAVAVMQQLGFERVWDMEGGVVAWSGAGLPLVL